MKRGMIFGAIVILLVVIAGSSAYYTVDQTQQAIVLQFGKPVGTVRDPGLHFKIPFIQKVILYEKRILEFDNPREEVIAADQKRLVVDAFAFYRIADPLKFYQAVLNEDGAKARFTRLLNASMRQVVGTVSLVDVVSGERQALMGQIRDIINKEAMTFGVEVIDVRIKRADLPKENSEAIYKRMQTEREREASEIRAQGQEQALRIRAEADRTRTVLISEAQKQSQITRGEGDAAAVKIFADSFGKDVDFFTFYRTMQAYRTALKGDDTTMVLSPDSDFLRYLKTFMDLGGSGMTPSTGGSATSQP